MPTSYQKFRQFLLTKYNEDVKEMRPSKLQFQELFYSNVSNDPKQLSHVRGYMVERGELKMLSDTGYFVYLDKMRENQFKDLEMRKE